MDADIVTLPETTIETGEQVAVAMRELGHPMWAHHAEYGTDGWDARSTTLLISPDLGDYAVIESSQDGIEQHLHGAERRRDADLRRRADRRRRARRRAAPELHAALARRPAVARRPVRRPRTSSWRATSTPPSTTWARSASTAARSAGATTRRARPATARSAPGRPRCRRCSARRSITSWHRRDWKPTGSLVLRSLADSDSDHRPLIVQLEPVD